MIGRHDLAVSHPQLKVVLDRTLWVDLEALSDAPGGDPEGSPTQRSPAAAIF